ncbi:MAG: carbohydrate ABC transporter permease [Eubacteriales bacterium]|nr:carbohydrate ABC transporter permease [Eubacteriales bacterium]
MKKGTKIFLTVLGFFLAIAFLTPILILVINSFKGQKEIMTNILGLPQSLNFNNYVQALDKLDFVTTVVNSLLITVISSVLLVFLSSACAWQLVRTKTRLSGILYLVFASAMLIPFQCVMLPLVRWMSTLGLMSRPGLIFMYIGFGGSMSMILFHGFIKNIPLELEEAAALDGAGPVKTFFLVVFPLLKNSAVTVSILNVMWIWNDFLLPSLIINKSGSQTLPLKTYLFFGQYSRRWDLATAALVITIIPIIIFYLACQKQIMNGVTEGAVK